MSGRVCVLVKGKDWRTKGALAFFSSFFDSLLIPIYFFGILRLFSSFGYPA